MKHIIRLFSCLWWSVQGFMWFKIQFMPTILCIGTGIILILCGVSCFSNNRNISILSQLLQMLYSIGFICFAFLIITVGYPDGWSVAGLSIIALLNITLCIIKGYKLITK
jgi:hypothetical protein